MGYRYRNKLEILPTKIWEKRKEEDGKHVIQLENNIVITKLKIISLTISKLQNFSFNFILF